MATIIKIPKKASKKEITKTLEKAKRIGKSNMLKHFGTLKRGLDGLKYQNELRNEWS